MNVVNLQANIDPSYYRLLSGQAKGSLVETFEARRPSAAERLAAGKALREKSPRTAHAHYAGAADRPDPVAILEQQNATRVQKLIPVRYARMLASPFAFLRGSAAVMAADLSRTPLTGLSVAACGDTHVSNFGVYASAERNLVFAINDFDEIHPGPGSGISSVWRPAPSSPYASWAATTPRPRTRRAPACAATASACGATPRWDISRSGTTASTKARCWARCRRRCAAQQCGRSQGRVPRVISAHSTSSPSRSTANIASSRTCR